jgi:hypothetical protein
VLVFSDVELSAADADNDTKLSELANAGGLHAMGILTGDDPAGKKQAISNEIYDQGLHGRMSIGGQDTFEARKGTDKWASGRLYLATPKKFESGVTFTLRRDVRRAHRAVSRRPRPFDGAIDYKGLGRASSAIRAAAVAGRTVSESTSRSVCGIVGDAKTPLARNCR